MIDYDALEDEFENLPSKEKIAKPTGPVNSHHSMLVKVESKINRLRKVTNHGRSI